METIEIVENKLPFMNGPKPFYVLDYDCTITLNDVVYTKEMKAEKKINAEANNKRIKLNDKKYTSITDFYDDFVGRSQADCLDECMCQQRSLQWHRAREFSITASNFGAAVGHNKYNSPTQCVLEKLWSTFCGNEYTEYGTFHEHDARESLLKALETTLRPTLESMMPDVVHFELIETGLLKHCDVPWIAVSPDGLLLLISKTGQTKWCLVEYKCPARLRDSKSHPYAKDKHNIPEYYYDQCQGIMGLLNEKPDILHMISEARSSDLITDCLFVVWQPHQMHITRMAFNDKYYSEFLRPTLETWYFKSFLPMALLKHNKQLLNNTLTVIDYLELNIPESNTYTS